MSSILLTSLQLTATTTQKQTQMSLVRLHEQYPINKSAVNGNNNTKTNTNVFGYMLLSGMM